MRLAPRPAVLAGREALLADIGVRLALGPVRPAPRVAVLCGLPGAGKTSVAVEYAHRLLELGGAGVCWQFAAEDPAVLAAQFAVLAAQLGARDLADVRDPVAAVHAVLARAGTGWLGCSTTYRTWRRWRRSSRPRGRGGCWSPPRASTGRRAGRRRSRCWSRRWRLSS